MRLLPLLPVLFLATTLASLAAPNEPAKAEHVVLIVWDGMRPDFATADHAPTLAALAHDGVFFANHHPVYPSSTNVNGAALATGDEPQHNGIISNQEYRTEIDPLRPFDTADFPALDLETSHVIDKYLTAPTLVDILQKAGFRTAIAGSKPVTQLFDRSRRREGKAALTSTVLYRGKVLPRDAATAIFAAIGPFPQRTGFPNAAEDAWTTRALTEVIWKEEVPKFSLLWLSEPDLSQHETAPGSPTSLAAIKSCDDNLAKVIAALKTKNALTNTDIFIVSDHGFSTIDLAIDVAARLRSAGFDAVREIVGTQKVGQVLVVSLGGSMEFYVGQHDVPTIQRLVDYLQRSDFAGVVLTREKMEGTFTLAQAQMATATAPDVVVASRWNDHLNKFGVPGEVASDLGKNLGQGTHTTFSRFDICNTLIASGPDFRRGWRDEIPSGNTDLAPTILDLLGLRSPNEMDGRILREAEARVQQPPAVTEKILEAQRDLGDAVWRQHLRTATVAGATYFLEGNGGQEPARR